MTKKLFLSNVVFIVFCYVLSAQQIATSNTMSLDALIQNTLGQGCVEISNISSTINGSVDDISSYGRFTKENSKFPFQNGLVLTTGSVKSAGNELNTAPLNEGSTSWGTDPDLEMALGVSGTMNATSIEFDFISASNGISFNYLLASEEYLGTNPCHITDRFALLIREVGSAAPYSNIALVPGTSLPVNTTNIRPKIDGFCPAQNPASFEGYNVGDTNYNGRTTVLTASHIIKPNVAYHIKIVIADQKDPGLDSAVFIEGNSFNATVDLGPDITTCASSTTLNTNLTNATYEWFLDNIMIPNAKSTSLSVTQSGIYKVQATLPLGNSFCKIDDEISVTLNVQETLDNIPDYVLCDDPSTIGKQQFDLKSRDAIVLESLPSSNVYVISYHLTSDQAKVGEKPITTIQNTENPQNIFIRIFDQTNNCVSLSGVKLIVNPSPLITKPDLLKICDIDGNQDGFTEIDLSQVTSQITSNYTDTSDLYVTYHANAVDVNSGENAIVLPYTNASSNQNIYVRLYDSNTGCFSTTTLDLIVSTAPVILIDRPYINACNQNGNDFATFDLTSELNRILDGLTGVSSSIHETFVDAQENKNVISNPSSYQNIIAEFQEVYIRVMDNQTGCFSIVPLELHANIAVTGLNLNDFNGCDNSQNGIVEFDLYAVEGQLLNSYLGFDVEFFENENGQQNDETPLDKAEPYSVNSGPATIYAYVTSTNCSELIPIKLVINPPIVLPTSFNLEYCGINQDGFSRVILSDFDLEVSENVDNSLAEYFNTELDILNNNPLGTTINVTGQRTIFVRVTNTQTSCFNTAAVNILINKPPVIDDNDGEDVVISVCEIPSPGYNVVDLTKAYKYLIKDATGLKPPKYYANYKLAQEGVAGTEIPNPTKYTSSPFKKINVRIEDENGCFSIGAIFIYINTPPIIPAIQSFQNCASDDTGITEFNFWKKDKEILNNQSDKSVLYFKNLADAESRNMDNVIDKFSAYSNNPTISETIYVRVEANNDPTCYATSSFDLEVDNLPSFNEATDIFICDDLGDDGFATFDLSVKESEIRRNATDNISFYRSLLEAENRDNPITYLINFKNTFNPQTIHARIDNGTFCYSLTSFSINVVPLPKVEAPSDLYFCGTVLTGPGVFNLEVVKILDLRPEDIVITYHESMIGVNNDNEIIADPKNYTTNSNLQTIYAKIKNTLPQESCYISIPINLNIVLPPSVNDFKKFDICPTPNNYFNLKTIDNALTSEPNIIITYFRSSSDAISNNLNTVLNPDYTYISSNDRIYARLENTITGCVSYYDFELVVNPLPIANKPYDLEDCDDDFDGRLTFDLSEQTGNILGTQSGLNYEVTYHQTQQAANEGTPVLDNLYSAANGQVIFARVYNIETGCFSTTEFLVTVNPKPMVNIPDQAICSDNPTSTVVVSAETNNPGDTYLWSTGATTSEIEIGLIGSYSVTVTGDFGCQTTSEFNVLAYESATIEVVETVDFSDPNNITITVSGNGDYLFILDGGPPQESNVFENVSLGYHTITVIDAIGCTETSKEVVVVDAPKFMTPNNDGYFDTWHITGIETLPGSVIYIYDRYGKLLTILNSNSEGWDGTYKGSRMPSSDYWYVGKINKNGNIFEVKGHFTLKL